MGLLSRLLGRRTAQVARAADPPEWVNVYRGMEQPFDGQFRPMDLGWYGRTLSVSESPEAASFYARKTNGMTFGEGANVMPLQAQGPFATQDDFSALVSQYMRGGRWSREKEDAAVQRATAELRRLGYRGVKGTVDSEIALFPDETGAISNVRSRFEGH